MDDPGAGNIFIHLAVVFLLILINALYSILEISMISVNDSKLERMAQDGDKRAARILKITKNPINFMSTIQAGVTLCGFLTAVAAAHSFGGRLALWISQLLPDVSYGVVNAVSLIAITVVICYFSLLYGIFIPKRIAAKYYEKLAFTLAPVMRFLQIISMPAVKALAVSTNMAGRLFGISPYTNEESVTEEEIRMMVDVGQEKGVIEDAQKEMINNIFEFDDVSVSEIMTHRTDIIALDANDPLADVIELAMEHGYSRIPVFEDELDDIVGIAYVKDLLKYVGDNLPKTKKMKDIMREAFYVPKTLSCSKLFQEMSERRVQMAIVVDEYGGTAGIVTLEDLLESIVGNIQDEYDNEDEEIQVIDEKTYTIDGTTDIEEVTEILGVKFPKGEYDTLGGFIINLLGFLPQDGKKDEVIYRNILFKVMNVEDRRIGKIRVEILPESDETDEGIIN